MHKLATQIWETNNYFTRIDWCNKIAINYFRQGRMKEILTKERQLCSDCTLFASMPLYLLDVGSCYNAFDHYKNNYIILSLDLCPATKDVHECDFTKLIITRNEIDESYLSSLPHTISHLNEETFSVVVFSLLLEYLPTPRHRWICCEKAYHLLKPEGLLFIVTPDSNHQNRNAAMIKSWKIALQHIGFVRINYEKLQHLHCMAFRKRHLCGTCSWKKKIDYPDEDMKVQNMIYIPQDFQNTDDDENRVDENRDDDEGLRQGFLQLPFNM
uniref:Uncharacterized protein n=1 Tax=Strigamia maritima TaxID=126957 RepID=T1JBH3_STRMM